MRLCTAFLAASLGLGSLASGCSETTPAPPVDASAVDAPDVPSLDAPDAPDVPTIDVAADRAMDLGSDRGPADAPIADVPIADVPRDAVDAGRCDPATGCHAFWCGCGRCNPSEITCTPDVRGCPLGCVSACPELDTAVCACSGGTCGAPVLRADAGTDAGADGGGLAAGQLCGSDGECATGLLCCYPCGIPGCMNRCGSPDPRTGRCPLLP